MITGLFGTAAPAAADANLILQIAMGVALLAGMMLARMKKYTAHATCQTTVGSLVARFAGRPGGLISTGTRPFPFLEAVRRSRKKFLSAAPDFSICFLFALWYSPFSRDEKREGQTGRELFGKLPQQ